MPITTRKLPNAVELATPVALRAFIVGVTDAVGTGALGAHYDITSTPSPVDYQNPVKDTALAVSPTGSQADLAHVIIQAEATRAVLLRHFADTLAHKISDATNLALIVLGAVPLAVDQGTVDTLNVALAAAFTAHESQAGVHSHNDATNVTSAAASTTLATSKTQAADTATQVNAHILNAFASASLNVLPA